MVCGELMSVCDYTDKIKQAALLQKTPKNITAIK